MGRAEERPETGHRVAVGFEFRTASASRSAAIIRSTRSWAVSLRLSRRIGRSTPVVSFRVDLAQSDGRDEPVDRGKRCRRGKGRVMSLMIPLLVPQRGRRIGACGAPGWHDGREADACDDQRQDADEGHRVGRTHAVEHAAQQPSGRKRGDDAEGGADCRQTEPVTKNPRTTRRRSAPSAMRMPISGVRCRTV